MTELMDPHDFAERLDRSFGAEPPLRPAADALVLGKRRLRRRRAGAAVAALATAGVVGAVSTLLPVGPTAPHQAGVGPATGGGPVTGASAGDLDAGSRAAVVDACLGTGNVLAQLPPEQSDGSLLLGRARLRTLAVAGNHGVATLAGDDGTRWGECRFTVGADGPAEAFLNVYPTDVRFPRRQVGGSTAYAGPYDRPEENSPDLKGTASTGVPFVRVACPVAEPEETPEYYRAAAACPTFLVTWNDRRPREVAAVKVVTPDGVTTWADVEDGYLSFGHTGTVTPQMAEELAAGEVPAMDRVVFYDEDGHALVDDRDPGHLPERADELAILDYPSLAWWLR